MGNGRHSGLQKNNGRRSSLPEGVTDITHKTDSGDYKVFRDTASGGYNYNGDGKDVMDFFKRKSNFEEVVKSISEKEKDHFYNWAIGEFMGSNKAEYSNLSSYEQRMLKTYDKILDKSVLHEGIVVRRLASFSLVNNGSRSVPSDSVLKSMEGNLINVRMPLSSSAAAEGLRIGSSGKNVEYVIHIPAGSKGAGMWIGDYRINAEWGPKQREFMVNRDTIFKQGKTTYNSKRGVYEVELYYVGRTKHKYD